MGSEERPCPRAHGCSVGSAVRSVVRRARVVARRMVMPAALALPGIAPALGAQDAVLLRIRPRVGDTLVVSVEQQVYLVGRTRRGGADTTMRMRTATALWSRILVRGFDGEATFITAITDSVSVGAIGSAERVSPDAIMRALEGRRLRMRVTPLGAATLLDAPRDLAAELRGVLSQMPATLPAAAIRVGESWSEAMRIPVSGRDSGGALVRATYRLDSLRASGALAFISMRGTIGRSADVSALPDGTRMSSAGTILGWLVLDRRRGWWLDAITRIALRSTITPPPERSGEPMRLETRIAQRMRVLPER